MLFFSVFAFFPKDFRGSARIQNPCFVFFCVIFVTLLQKSKAKKIRVFHTRFLPASYKGEFPAWVLEYEHDPLLWVSGTDGMSLLWQISGAVGSFLSVLKHSVPKTLAFAVGLRFLLQNSSF